MAPLLLAGCATWMGDGLELKEATAEQLMALLREREAAIHTMKGLFRVQVKGAGIPLAPRVEAALFFRRPHRLRLRGFNHVGGTVFDLVLADEDYRLRLPGQELKGRADALAQRDRLGRLLQLSVLAVSGAVGIESVSPSDAVVLVEEDERYRLEVLAKGRNGRPVRLIWFDRRSLQVVREDRLTESGALEASIRFEDFRSIAPAEESAGFSSSGATASADALFKPFQATIEGGDGQGTVQINFHEIVANPDLKPDELGGAGVSAMPVPRRSLAWRERRRMDVERQVGGAG